MRAERSTLLWIGLWLGVVAAALIARPLMPMDETRYLAVAWEMWLGGDFLVPHLNGETYSHKPPLLFWLINAGWAIFGVNDWWPRLVAPLFGLGTLFMTARLAGRLWPDRPDVARLAPFIVMGSLFFTIFTTLTMFDMILAFFSVLGLCGILTAWRGDYRLGFAVLAVAIGLGVLAKGPAILLHTLTVAALAPLWGPKLSTAKTNWAKWYGGTIGAVLLGAAIGLAWAIPAAKAGGPAYAEAIFWGQSAGRMVNSFAHGRPWWWFIAALPVMVLPWAIWPTLWKALPGAKSAISSGAGRFCASWFVPAFIVFSAISGKQPHYLLPEFPALALFAAFLLTHLPDPCKRPRLTMALPAALFVLVGAAVASAPFLPVSLPFVVEGLQPIGGIVLIVATLVIVASARPGIHLAVSNLTALSAAAIVAAHLAAGPVLTEVYDVSPVAKKLASWQKAGHPIAHYGKYHGQFQFPGRLREPVAVIGDGNAADWLAQNPTGKIVTYHRNEPTGATPEIARRFRGKWMIVWDAATATEDPDILKRR
ncbi:MAG: glycosyltransferase family 39 protein [Rhodospirillales bacterium]|jgi:4-amino-4-deoxy-L-arabinose transferase-like glycosyltransferase|nr:glycosyltransferase family 39 protein [Rhodospirillales bacterium]